MSISPKVLASFSAAAIVFVAASAPVHSASRDACGLLSLAQVRDVAGSRVSVRHPGSSVPKTEGDSTFSTCTYAMTDATGRSARISLMWAPSAKLLQTSQFYTQRHKEAPGVKGDVLVLTWVGTASHGADGDWPASQRLLAAALHRL